MDTNEFAKLMQLIFKHGCCLEENHIAAELLMCDLLEELGYKDGIDIFKKNVNYD